MSQTGSQCMTLPLTVTVRGCPLFISRVYSQVVHRSSIYIKTNSGKNSEMYNEYLLYNFIDPYKAVNLT